MLTCLYCRENKGAERFKKAEHVLPQAFGRFERNLTLNGVVCDDCNQFFGDHLERDFARDTPDGLERFFKGGKDLDEYKSLGPRSAMTFWIDQGPFQGAQVVQRPIDGVMRVEPLPQVGFSVNGEPPIIWFPLESMPPKSEMVTLFESGKRHVQLLNVVDHEAAFAKLRAAGLEFGETFSALPPAATSTSRVEWRATLDDRFGRVLTKVGLNYVALVCGADVALRSEFDAARRYARYGETMPTRNWTVEDALLVNSTGPLPMGHALTLSFYPDGFVVAQLSFHHSRRYRMKLAEGCAFIEQPRHAGHFFDLATKQVVEIRPTEVASD
jgi:hypothetical protein